MCSRYIILFCIAWLSVGSSVLAQDRLALERAWSVEEQEWVDPVTTRLSLHSAQSGRLVLLDQHRQLLRQAEGHPVWLVYLWQMENAEELPDHLFYASFIPDVGGGPAFQRIIRVTPGSDARFTLVQEQGQWLWRSMAESPQETPLLSSEADFQVEQPAWMNVQAVDEELALFWKQLSEVGIEQPSIVDESADLQAQGYALMGEGLYAEALLILKQSYDIDPLPELLDRIRRLERYLDLQAQ